jgi:hypothetical protein
MQYFDYVLDNASMAARLPRTWEPYRITSETAGVEERDGCYHLNSPGVYVSDTAYDIDLPRYVAVGQRPLPRKYVSRSGRKTTRR